MRLMIVLLLLLPACAQTPTGEAGAPARAASVEQPSTGANGLPFSLRLF